MLGRVDVDAVDRGVDVDEGVDMDVDQAGPHWTTLDVDAVDRRVDDRHC